MMKHDDKIFVAGHKGLVGSAIVRKLLGSGFTNLVLQSHAELDLTNQADVREFFDNQHIKHVILAAGKVGGIHANNTYPAEFIHQNIMIEANVIDAAYQHGIERLLFLGSSCIYPKDAQQPIKESALLTDVLEPTNEPYAIAKIAGITLCESYNRQYGTDFRSVMPTNIYGINDNFHPENSHVIPALIRRFHDAKLSKADKVSVWGSGNAMREFLFSDDLAEASLFILQLDKEIYQSNTKPMLSHINVGTGKDISIREMAETLKRVVCFEGELKFDDSKPDGSKRKLLDVSRLMSLGWTYCTELEEGLKKTYEWYEKIYFRDDRS